MKIKSRARNKEPALTRVSLAAPAARNVSRKALMPSSWAVRRPYARRGSAYAPCRPRVIILAWGDKWHYENKRLLEALHRYGIDAKLCHPEDFGITISSKLDITCRGKPISRPHLVLARTGSATGTHAEAVLRQFELMGIPVINSIASIQAAMNKAHTIQKARTAGLPVPLTHVYSSRNVLKGKVAPWNGGYPCVIKILTGSQGNGVIPVRSASDLKAYIGLLKVVHRSQPFIIQQFVGRPGEDVRVFVIGGRAVGAMKRKSTDGDFRANISRDGEGSRFELTPNITHLSEAAARLLGLEIAGVDVLLSNGTALLSEINSAPGFAGFDKYCKADTAGLIAKYVADKLAARPAQKSG
jgi:gamma-F420-2:alpha-L-glutamate ligase